MKKKMIILIISILTIFMLTYLPNLVFINISIIRKYLNIIINLLFAVIVIIAMKLTNKKIDLDLKNKKQYLIGISIGLALSLIFTIIPILFKINLAGPHLNFSIEMLLSNLFEFMLIIGPIEELIFRVYIQDTIVEYFHSNKWISVIITSLLFGIWHIINGSLIQVIFTFIIGLILGFSKYLIKDCKYVGLAIGHGLYDFLATIIRMFII